MKINILSDLHLNHQGLAHPDTDADVVVLAGDISRPQQAIDWAREFNRPVLYVPGNHEFYGASIAEGLVELKALSAGTNVHVLDCGEAVIGGVRFLGATLWTDLLLFGSGRERTAALDEARYCLRDFSRIHADPSRSRFMTPEDSAMMHARQVDWLESRIASPFDGPTVVITHHAPSRKSIHRRFADSPLNLCFVSDLTRLMDGDRVQLWIHGHTHDSFDYSINGTRVVCNPRGYAVDGINENAAFDADLTVAVAPATVAVARATVVVARATVVVARATVVVAPATVAAARAPDISSTPAAASLTR